ncbi:AmmeMemoRadiSam system protein B [Porticoccus sp.]
MLIRQPAVAGSFYPDNPMLLQRQVDDLLASGDSAALRPKALIVPHAGYIYSGPIAASAYRLLSPLAKQINRVVLLGPSHRVPLRGLAAPSDHLFRTPLGDIVIDREGIDSLVQQSLVSIREDAHQWEHSLEVQLPFLQRTLENFQLLPLVVGDAGTDQVAAVLRACWGGDETLIVISSDLSHYHGYPAAQQLDRQTTAMIASFSAQLDGNRACGCNGINGLLSLAKEKQLSMTTLDLRNSGDTAGDRDRVVGYGAYALY